MRRDGFAVTDLGGFAVTDFGFADSGKARFRSRSVGLRDLAVPDRQHIVASSAGNAVLAHEGLGRFEHRLAAEEKGLGVVLGEPEREGFVLARPDELGKVSEVLCCA